MPPPADAPAIAAIYGPICVETPISFELEPPDAAEMARRMAAVLARWPWLVLADGPEVLGYAYFKAYNERAAYAWTLESSIYVAAGARGRGVGRALYTALFALARGMGYQGVVAGITLPNAGSVGLHEAFGFRPSGKVPAAGFKHGGWHDVGYWHLPLGELPAAPPPPLTLAEVLGTPAWDAAIAAGLEAVLLLLQVDDAADGGARA